MLRCSTLRNSAAALTCCKWSAPPAGKSLCSSNTVSVMVGGVRNFHHQITALNSNNPPIFVNITESNISPSVQSKIGRNLHRKQNHPLCIIKTAIQNQFIRQAEKARGR